MVWRCLFQVLLLPDQQDRRRPKFRHLQGYLWMKGLFFCLQRQSYTAFTKYIFIIIKRLRHKPEFFVLASQCAQARYIFADYIKFQVDLCANLKFLKVRVLVSVRDDGHAERVVL